VGKPLVSVLTPSFNQGRYLRDCLTSVERQTYDAVEHVVYDGGSTDDSLELLRSVDNCLRWVSEPDGGQSDALNSAFASSSGEIIGWLNADDGYADRRAVEWAARRFLARPDIDVLFGHTLLVNESNTVLQVRAAPPFSVRALRAVNYVLQPSVFVRRAAVERLGTFVRPDLHYVMDRDLLLRLGTSGQVGRLKAIIAFDRHQRRRKILQAGFEQELAAFERELDPLPAGSAAMAFAVRAWIRYAGAVRAASLRRTLMPTIAFDLAPAATRLRWQLLSPRRRLPFGSLTTPGSTST
jgi:glycosyltransferase involved in cell wall biosynthesis